ncbi:MAG TPA: hypothetical protein PKW90_18290, partial [Myxococcota bacterium]|nr:hypothetical protein [Myxococcota bacterium]
MGLLQVVLAALPGGTNAAVLALVGLIAADVAVLAGIEGALIGDVGEGASLRHVVMFVAGGLWAAYASRQLVAAMGTATNTAISDILRRILQAVDRLDLRGVEVLGSDRVHHQLTQATPAVASAGLP